MPVRSTRILFVSNHSESLYDMTSALAFSNETIEVFATGASVELAAKMSDSFLNYVEFYRGFMPSLRLMTSLLF